MSQRPAVLGGCCDLRGEHTQAEIAERLGWSESKVKQYSALLGKVVTGVLELAQSHQEGRVTSEVTSVTFSEYWFRTSGRRSSAGVVALPETFPEVSFKCHSGRRSLVGRLKFVANDLPDALFGRDGDRDRLRQRCDLVDGGFDTLVLGIAEEV